MEAYSRKLGLRVEIGSPMFLLATNRLALCAACQNGVVGPFISCPFYWPNVLPLLGTNHVDYLDLAAFAKP